MSECGPWEPLSLPGSQADTPGAFLGGGVRGWGQTPQGSGQGCLVDCGRGPWL